MLAGSLSSPEPPRASSSSPVLVYISRYCVSAVPGVAGTDDDDTHGPAAGAAAVTALSLSLSLLALSSSTAREGRRESVRRGEDHVCVWDAEPPTPPSRRGSGASASSPALLRGGGGTGCRMGEAVVDRLVVFEGAVDGRTVLSRPRIPAGVSGTDGLTPLVLGWVAGEPVRERAIDISASEPPDAVVMWVGRGLGVLFDRIEAVSCGVDEEL